MQQTTPRVPIDARRHPLVHEVEQSLRHRIGIAPDVELVVGVSGGCDSLALLLAGAALAQRRSLRVHAAHVHHHLRAEADAEMEHVQRICDQLAVPLVIEHLVPPTHQRSIAAWARQQRYQALGRIAKRVGAGAIAVAHHADDQFETMLMALCRGAGIAGLGGMAWTRPLDDQQPQGVQLIRPLLGVQKVDCMAMCEAANLQWCEDASNLDPATARGRLRRDVLPVLESLWPGAAGRAVSAASILQLAEQCLHERIEAVFGPAATRRWERQALASQPLELIAAGLRRAAIDAEPLVADSLSHAPVIKAAIAIRSEETSPREFHWPGEITLNVTASAVELQQCAGSQRSGAR